MTQVFISYSRKDLSFVEKLAKDLRTTGFEVWYDLSNLEVGKNWGKEIQAAIHKSKYLIVVLSPNSIDSEWVEREYLFANNLKLKIIPFVYKTCELPLWSLNIHYIDMASSNYRRSYEELLKVLGPLERPEPVPAPRAETPTVQPEAVTPVQPGRPEPTAVTAPAVKAAQPVPRKGVRKPLVVVAGIVVVLGLAAAGIFGLDRGNLAEMFSGVGMTRKSPTATIPAPTGTVTSTITPWVFPTGIVTSTSTPAPPAPAWVGDFAEPILSLINLHNPHIRDNCVGLGDRWEEFYWLDLKGKETSYKFLNEELVITNEVQIPWTQWYTDYVLEFDWRFETITSEYWKIFFRGKEGAFTFFYNFVEVSASPLDSNQYHFKPSTDMNHAVMIVKDESVALFINDQPIYYGDFLTNGEWKDGAQSFVFGKTVTIFDNISIWNLNNLK